VVRFIFLFVWLIFVLTFGGVFMEKSDAFGSYLDTVFFKNQFFNLNLLYFLGTETLLFSFRFLGKNNPQATEAEIASWAAPIHKRGILIHIGIVFGGMAGMFFGAKYFAIAFLLLKILMDFSGFLMQNERFRRYFEVNSK
jgi:hypothetical protein